MSSERTSIQADLAAIEAAVAARSGQPYVLRLYVTGTTPISNRAIVNIRKLCEKHLEGRYHLEIVDVLQDPTMAAAAQIVAVPALIKELPLPLRRFVGDMSQTGRILVGLDLAGTDESGSHHV